MIIGSENVIDPELPLENSSNKIRIYSIGIFMIMNFTLIYVVWIILLKIFSILFYLFF